MPIERKKNTCFYAIRVHCILVSAVKVVASCANTGLFGVSEAIHIFPIFPVGFNLGLTGLNTFKLPTDLRTGSNDQFLNICM